MKALRVTEKTAGTESRAKIKSVVSMSSSTTASGVSAKRPFEAGEKLLAVKVRRDGETIFARAAAPGFFPAARFPCRKKAF